MQFSIKVTWGFLQHFYCNQAERSYGEILSVTKTTLVKCTVVNWACNGVIWGAFEMTCLFCFWKKVCFRNPLLLIARARFGCKVPVLRGLGGELQDQENLPRGAGEEVRGGQWEWVRGHQHQRAVNSERLCAYWWRRDG